MNVRNISLLKTMGFLFISERDYILNGNILTWMIPEAGCLCSELILVLNWDSTSLVTWFSHSLFPLSLSLSPRHTVLLEWLTTEAAMRVRIDPQGVLMQRGTLEGITATATTSNWELWKLDHVSASAGGAWGGGWEVLWDGVGGTCWKMLINWTERLLAYNEDGYM